MMNDKIERTRNKWYFRSGMHRLTEPLLITPAQNELHIVGEAGAILTSNMVLDCRWEPFRDGIFKTKIQDGVRVGAQLIVDGMPATRARFPKCGYAKVAAAIPDNMGLNLPDDEMRTPGHAPKGLLYDKESFTPRHWANPETAVCHVFQAMYWGNMQFRIVGCDEEAGALFFGEGGMQIGAKWHADPLKINENSTFFVENVFEELTDPNEWFFDAQTRELYFIPPVGLELSAAVFETPQLETLIEVRGSQRVPVQEVTIENLRFTGTEETYFAEYDIPSLGDWAIHRGGALLFEGTKDCTISRCEFANLGGNAVFFNGYNRGARAYGNYLHDIGESAFCLVGEQSRVVGSQKPYPFECRVEHNLITRCGVFGKQVAGVFISVAKRITAGHNHIHNMPRAGICINDGTWGGHVIEYNRIHDTCLETGDHGPFNAWGRDRYWCLLHSHGGKEEEPVCHQAGDVKIDQMDPVIVRGNFFKEKSGWGLDLDDGASNYEIYDNVCVGVSMKLREGAYRLIENNIWYGGANSPCFHVGNIDNHDRYLRNITVMDTKTAKPEHDLDFRMGRHYGEMYTLIKPPTRGPWLQEMDYNLFWNDLGAFRARVIGGERGMGEKREYTLEAWQALGYDRHSVFADPGFMDAANGDYRLRPDSPALALGIHSVDTRLSGPEQEIISYWNDSIGG